MMLMSPWMAYSLVKDWRPEDIFEINMFPS